jgi:hypothetical protein
VEKGKKGGLITAQVEEKTTTKGNEKDEGDGDGEGEE